MHPVILAGVGRIASKHLRAISALPQLRLAGIADPNPERARTRLEKILGSSLPSDLIYHKQFEAFCSDSSWKRESDGTPILAIATRSDSHGSLAIQGLQNGFALVLEKPMALDLASCRRILRLSEERKLPVALCHIYRFLPLIPELRELIQSGAFGSLIHARAEVCWGHDGTYYQGARGTWAADGGALINQTVHAVDLLRYLIGIGPTSWSGTLHQNQHHSIEAEDLGTAWGRFENCEASVSLLGTTATDPDHKEALFELILSRGRIRAGIRGHKLILTFVGRGSKRRLVLKLLTGLLAHPQSIQKANTASQMLSRRLRLRSYLSPHLGIYADLVFALERGVAPRADARAGLESVADILAIYSSARAKGAEVAPDSLRDSASSLDMVGFFENQRKGRTTAESTEPTEDVKPRLRKLDRLEETL